MFNCGICGTTVSPGIKSRHLILEKRPVTYPFRQGVNRVAKWMEDKQERQNSSNDNGGKGWEIATQVKACPSCCRKFDNGDIPVHYVKARAKPAAEVASKDNRQRRGGLNKD
jgi:hypothetical protein